MLSGGEHSTVDEHLAGCAACVRWHESAFALTRSLRLRPAVAAPDVTDAVLAELPAPVVRLPWERIALGVVALIQVALSAAQAFGWSAGMHTDMDAAMSVHLFDESTAWNLATGIGLAFAAWRARTAGALVPLYGAFLVVLGIFCVRDLLMGHVTAGRVATHGLLVIGFALLLVVHRRQRRDRDPVVTYEAAEHEEYGLDSRAPRAGEQPAVQRRGLRPVSRRRSA